MLLLHTASHDTQVAWKHPHGGRLVVPRDCARVDETAACGIPWAADNSAFGEFDEPAFRRMLDVLHGVDGGLWVAAPDVVAQTPVGPVGDWAATLARFWQWRPELERRDLPTAIVLQDGLDVDEIPWDHVAAVFIGGSARFKFSPVVRRAAIEARRHGRLVHFGRVNSDRRAHYAGVIEADSFDGSSFSLWRDTYLPGGLKLAAALSQGPQLTLDA